MEAQPGRVFIARVSHGEDLLNALNDFCLKKNIRAGQFSLIGAVSCAVVACYDQAAKRYEPPLRFEGPLEILSCTGNISLKDGRPFVHAHIIVSDRSGMACGGHLISGTNVFAAEFTVIELICPSLERRSDETTGLALWEM